NELKELLDNYNLAEIFITSQAEACIGNGEYKGETVEVTVLKAQGDKCERCWIYGDIDENGLCKRCKNVL
ncbi:MAG: hypothetical protein RSE07_05500, partial [Oscillospiraceae bacterium]